MLNGDQLFFGSVMGFGKIKKMYNELYKTLESVRKETISTLDKEISFQGNNWIDINSWLFSEYTKEHPPNIVIFEFQKLFKEIYWLQFIFLNCNYSMIYRNLRYIWEMMSKAQYIFNKFHHMNLEDQFKELVSLEKNKYGWKIIKETLQSVLSFTDDQIENNVHPTWDYLNKHVHPSVKQMDLILEKDPRSLVTDSFNNKLAKLSIEIIDQIFDFIYAAIFKQFDKLRKYTLNYHKLPIWKDNLPYTFNTLKS